MYNHNRRTHLRTQVKFHMFLIVCVCFQQNLSLLEAEEKTVEQLGIEDGTQILIEGDHCHLF